EQPLPFEDDESSCHHLQRQEHPRELSCRDCLRNYAEGRGYELAGPAQHGLCPSREREAFEPAAADAKAESSALSYKERPEAWLAYFCGNRTPWRKDDDSAGSAKWQYWRGWSPQGRVPWKQEADPRGPNRPMDFPTYDGIQLQSRPTGASGSQAVLQNRDSEGRMVPDMQHALNHARKMETRLSKLVAAKARAAEKWEVFQDQMKNRLIAERKRFEKDMDRFVGEIQEAEGAQRLAREVIVSIVLDSKATKPAEPREEKEWGRVFDSWMEEAEADMDGVLRRALQERAAVITPQRGRTAPPMTPVRMDTSGPPPGLDTERDMSPREYPTPATIPPPGLGKTPGSHPGQRDRSARRSPLAEEAPRASIKAATIQRPTASAGVMTFQDRLDVKRRALQPFGRPVPEQEEELERDRLASVTFEEDDDTGQGVEDTTGDS
ncbi:unnamed protein product, partial [Symbiodinium sp. CCMP2456]